MPDEQKTDNPNPENLRPFQVKKNWLEVRLSEDELAIAKGIGRTWAKNCGLDLKSQSSQAGGVEVERIQEQARAEMAFSKATGRYFVTDRLSLNPGSSDLPVSRINPLRPARYEQGRGGVYYPYDVVEVLWRPEEPALILPPYNDYDNFCFVSEVGDYFYVTGYALGKHVTARGKQTPDGISLAAHNFEPPIRLRVWYRPVAVDGETRELLDVERNLVEKKSGKQALTGFD